MDERNVTVPEGGESDRLDRWLPKLLGISRGEARRLIDAGAVYVLGKRCRNQSRPVGAGVELRCVLSGAAVAARILAAPGPAPTVVFRDEHLIVLDKPAGMPVSATRETVFGTAQRWLEVDLGLPYVALHHRLDRQARGLLAVGVSLAANPGLARAFSERIAERRYRAVLDGSLVGEEGVWHHRLVEEGRQRWAAPPLDPSDDQEMRSRWRLLERRGGRSLVEVTLETGRTHQIRLQAAASGAPVLGDELYGGAHPDGLHLQAFALRLPHPVGGEELAFELPAPPGWVRTAASAP